MSQIRPRALLTGATGFIGRVLRNHLEIAGVRLRCASRFPDRVARLAPSAEWVRMDFDRPETLVPALEGCDVAFNLVHSMADGQGYPEREAAGAQAFAAAAARAGVQRLVYLGGVAPSDLQSRHLGSRLETGRILREGEVPCVELRAAMIAGPGSTSWQMVRDLSARLPLLLEAPWFQNGSWPVYVDDIAAALMHAAYDLPEADTRAWFDMPGPERITHADLLARVMTRMGRSPVRVPIPGVPLAAARIGLSVLTGAEPVVARELVAGLTTDLDPSGPLYWKHMSDFRLTPLDEMIDRCLAADARGISVSRDLLGFFERFGLKRGAG